MDITRLLSISLGAILVNNFILVQFLGICPFMGVSKKIDTAVGMGFAVIFVMGLASALCYPVNVLLMKLDLEYMQTVAFILVIAALVQFVEMFLKKSMPSLYEALGVYLPLIVVNCIILARAEAFASKNGPFASICDGIGMGLGFTVALAIIGLVREFIGSGTLFDITVLPEAFPRTLLFVMAPGAFFTLGCLMAALNHFRNKKKA